MLYVVAQGCQLLISSIVSKTIGTQNYRDVCMCVCLSGLNNQALNYASVSNFFLCLVLLYCAVSVVISSCTQQF